jgi:hypothetical protein
MSDEQNVDPVNKIIGITILIEPACRCSEHITAARIAKGNSLFRLVANCREFRRGFNEEAATKLADTIITARTVLKTTPTITIRSILGEQNAKSDDQSA